MDPRRATPKVPWGRNVRCWWAGQFIIPTYNLETHSISSDLGGIALSHFENIHLFHTMGSLGPTHTMNGTSAVNGSAPVNGHSPAEANGENLEPIAVVGMSCRLPGDASDTQKLWELLTKGRSAWSKVPKDRWNQEGFHDPAAEGKVGRVRTHDALRPSQNSDLGLQQNV
jgi:hypothetical protein